ncbi:protein TRIGALACTOSYLDIACYLGLYCEROL 4, chloroplastic [Macadamia integrifolia]|uniref:protein TRIGALACTOSYLDIACYLGLYCEROL 4, chloroplastic n=1 Tax=Macadamia integrifolia TaxID=60698 RepID=UPI001C4FE26B|nr:protein TRIGALACTOSYLDIACYLGLYCEROL 4, chloroplastic [Macadamia integrifolia]
MANLRLAMDSAFWDTNISSTQTLEGTARLVPGEPFPLDGSRASRALRAQQLSLLGNGFPLGIIPSYSPTSEKELGSFSLQKMLLRTSTPNWWLGLIGQFRPKKLFSSIKAELAGAEELDLSTFKETAKHFVDKSLYAIGLCSQLSLTPETSVLLSTEKHGERKRRYYKAMLFHKLPHHDVTLEAAWPELFIDRNGKYWEVPESISLDLSSLVSESGLRYRFSIHKNSGHPQAVNGTIGDPPLALMPGLCAKTAFSYEKSMDFWRQKETKKEMMVKTDKGFYWRPSYDVRLREPHAAISGIIGCTCAAWLWSSEAVDSRTQSRDGGAITLSYKKRNPLNADFFGSICYTFQHGKFRKLFGDLTRVDTRLDVCSGSAFARRAVDAAANIFRNSPVKRDLDPLALPRLNLIFQQQVAGPIVFRVDSKFLLDSLSIKHGPSIEDVRYSLSYSLRLLNSGKVVVWYSPKRKEGMIELRLFEF